MAGQEQGGHGPPHPSGLTSSLAMPLSVEDAMRLVQHDRGPTDRGRDRISALRIFLCLRVP